MRFIAFYKARAGRIVPNLAVLLFVLCVLSFTSIYGFATTPQAGLQDLLTSVSTLSYDSFFLRGGNTVLAWAPLWSLMIEEKFYLVFPLVILICRKEWVVAICMAGICIMGPVNRFNNSAVSYESLGCIDSIAFGVLTALACHHFRETLRRPICMVLITTGGVIIAATYTLTKSNDMLVAGPSIIACGTALILASSRTFDFNGARMILLPLTILGTLSYEIYLFHIAIYSLTAVLIRAMHLQNASITFLIVVPAVVIVALGMNRFFAEPTNRWIRSVKLSAAHQSP